MAAQAAKQSERALFFALWGDVPKVGGQLPNALGLPFECQAEMLEIKGETA